MSALVDELLKRAKVKSGMLRMGEPIAFGSDADVIDELSAELTTLQSRLEAAEAEIERLTPLAVAYDYLEPPAGREIAEARVEELQKALAHCDVICAHALEHYKGPVAMKIKREIAVHVRGALSPAPTEEGKP